MPENWREYLVPTLGSWNEESMPHHRNTLLLAARSSSDSPIDNGGILYVTLTENSVNSLSSRNDYVIVQCMHATRKGFIDGKREGMYVVLGGVLDASGAAAAAVLGNVLSLVIPAGPHPKYSLYQFRKYMQRHRTEMLTFTLPTGMFPSSVEGDDSVDASDNLKAENHFPS
jgi:hypothetical protein